MKDSKEKQVLFLGEYQCEGGGLIKRVKEDEDSGCSL
jgi:hypothetical protein